MKKLLGIVVLGLLLSGNAFADKPVIICSFLSLEGKWLGEHIFDLNVSNIYKITEYDSTGIRWYYFADTGEKLENSVNRLTGRIQYTGFTGLSLLTISLTLLNFSISCVPH